MRNVWWSKNCFFSLGGGQVFATADCGGSRGKRISALELDDTAFWWIQVPDGQDQDLQRCPIVAEAVGYSAPPT